MHSVDPFFCLFCSLPLLLRRFIVYHHPYRRLRFPSLSLSDPPSCLCVLSNGIFVESNIGFFCSWFLPQASSVFKSSRGFGLGACSLRPSWFMVYASKFTVTRWTSNVRIRWVLHSCFLFLKLFSETFFCEYFFVSGHHSPLTSLFPRTTPCLPRSLDLIFWFDR